MKQHFLLYRSTKINVRLHPTTSPRLVGEAGPSLKSSPKPRTGFTEFFYPKQPSPKQYNAFCLCSGKRRNYPSLILYLNVFTINLCPKIVSNLKTCKSRTTSPNLREADPGGSGGMPPENTHYKPNKLHRATHGVGAFGLRHHMCGLYVAMNNGVSRMSAHGCQQYDIS
jgi:hypothetical protein